MIDFGIGEERQETRDKRQETGDLEIILYFRLAAQ